MNDPFSSFITLTCKYKGKVLTQGQLGKKFFIELLKQLNEIEVKPVTLKDGTSETERVAEWMYRNKTKVVYEIINKEFDDVYDLLNGMLKSEYTELMGYMRIWHNLSKNL